MPGFARCLLFPGPKRLRVGQLDNAQITVQVLEEATVLILDIALLAEGTVGLELIGSQITANGDILIQYRKVGRLFVGPEVFDESVPRHFGFERNLEDFWVPSSTAV